MRAGAAARAAAGITAGTAAVITTTAAEIATATTVMAPATAASSASALAVVTLLAFATVGAAAGRAALAGGWPALGARFTAVALAAAMTVLAIPLAAISAGERFASTGHRRTGRRFFRCRFAAKKPLQPAEETAGRLGFFNGLGQRGALLEFGLLGARGAGLEFRLVAALGAEGAALFTARAHFAARFVAFLAEGTGVPALGRAPVVFRREDVKRGFLLGNRRGCGGRGSDGRRSDGWRNHGRDRDGRCDGNGSRLGFDLCRHRRRHRGGRGCGGGEGVLIFALVRDDLDGSRLVGASGGGSGRSRGWGGAFAAGQAGAAGGAERSERHGRVRHCGRWHGSFRGRRRSGRGRRRHGLAGSRARSAGRFLIRHVSAFYGFIGRSLPGRWEQPWLEEPTERAGLRARR